MEKKKKSRETISQNKNDFFSPINHFVYTIYVKMYYEHVRIHARGWLNVYIILWHHIFFIYDDTHSCMNPYESSREY
jgi:hypothetical protein